MKLKKILHFLCIEKSSKLFIILRFTFPNAFVTFKDSTTSITTDLWRKICIVTKQNALFKEILNFLIDLRSVQINFHKGVRVRHSAPNCLSALLCLQKVLTGKHQKRSWIQVTQLLEPAAFRQIGQP